MVTPGSYAWLIWQMSSREAAKRKLEREKERIKYFLAKAGNKGERKSEGHKNDPYSVTGNVFFL